MQSFITYSIRFTKIILINITFFKSIDEICDQPLLDKLDQNGEEKFVQKVVRVLDEWQSIFGKLSLLQCALSVVMVAYFLLINGLMQGAFAMIGLDWLVFIIGHSNLATNPLIHAFPSKGTCAFPINTFGDLEFVDCWLYLNNFVAQIFLVIWFWFLFVISAQVWYLLERIFYIVRPDYRLMYMERIAPTIRDKPSICKLITKDVRKWYILFLISKNMTKNTSKSFEIMINLLAKFDCKSPNEMGQNYIVGLDHEQGVKV